jgi:hypothetical protein
MEPYLEKHLEPLVGHRIVEIIEDSDYADNGFYGFRLDDGTLVWVLMDPEGNGPGHLDIEKQ